MYFSLRPAEFRASMTSLMKGMVVVMREDRAMMSASTSLALEMKFRLGVSHPKSWTVNPLALSMEATIRSPRSCMSPSTVPMTTVPALVLSSSDLGMCASSTLMAASMASAPSTRWGSQSSPASNLSPISRRPTARPFSMAVTGFTPASTAAFAASAVASASKLSTASESPCRIPSSLNSMH